MTITIPSEFLTLQFWLSFLSVKSLLYYFYGSLIYGVIIHFKNIPKIKAWNNSSEEFRSSVKQKCREFDIYITHEKVSNADMIFSFLGGCLILPHVRLTWLGLRIISIIWWPILSVIACKSFPIIPSWKDHWNAKKTSATGIDLYKLPDRRFLI